jgi:hypothetical protein
VALKPHERPFVEHRYHTHELPDLPQRDYRIPASGWIEAPATLRALGEDLREPVEYKRRIGRYLLWRAGPPVGEARYMAVRDDLAAEYRFDLHGKTGDGLGADGRRHQRFRTWKQSLAEPAPEPGAEE